MATVVLVGAEYEENLSLRYLASAVVGILVLFQLRARELLAFAFHLRSLGFSGHICVGGHFATFEYRNILRDTRWTFTWTAARGASASTRCRFR